MLFTCISFNVNGQIAKDTSVAELNEVVVKPNKEDNSFSTYTKRKNPFTSVYIVVGENVTTDYFVYHFAYKVINTVKDSIYLELIAI